MSQLARPQVCALKAPPTKSGQVRHHQVDSPAAAPPHAPPREPLPPVTPACVSSLRPGAGSRRRCPRQVLEAQADGAGLSPKPPTIRYQVPGLSSATTCDWSPPLHPAEPMSSLQTTSPLVVEVE